MQGNTHAMSAVLRPSSRCSNSAAVQDGKEHRRLQRALADKSTVASFARNSSGSGFAFGDGGRLGRVWHA